MAKPRKTELPDEVLKWMNPDMEDETTSGKGDDEDLEVTPEGVGAGGFTNSPLVTYTKLSPFKNSPRNQPISKIIIHHMAGVASVESFGEIVTAPGREMSANYAIGNDGRIGLYCSEEDRCWCSSSAWVDHRGIAIEVSNSKLGEPWPISKKAWDSMINLCADICKRNNIPKLVYTGDKTGSLCFHRWFAATGCVPIDTTELLTEKGWQYLRDLKIGDKVATVTTKNFCIKFNPIENMVTPKLDTVYHVGDMTITRDHRVLNQDPGKMDGYNLKQYQLICDGPFSVPCAGYTTFPGLDISSSEMVFLLEMQRIGNLSDDGKTLEFSYITENQVGYFDTLVKNCGFECTRTQDDLGPVVFRVTSIRALSLVNRFLSGKDFTWEWLKMNPTQFSYFIYKVTTHENGTWNRHYHSASNVNVDVVQAICALNERATKYDPIDGILYVSDTGSRSVNPRESTAQENIMVSCVTVKGECFLMRQNGVTTLTGNCPGEYIFSRAQQICDEVNAKLEELRDEEMQEALKEQAKQKETAKQEETLPEVVPVKLATGCMVKFNSPDATYYTGAPIPAWVKNQNWYVTSVIGSRVVLGRNESNNANINSPVDAKYLTVIENAAAQPEKKFVPYTKKFIQGTKIYDISTKIAIKMITVAGVYTIVDEAVTDGVKYGKLKSGAGWVVLSANPNITSNIICEGDTVSVIKPITYDGKAFNVYEKSYKVLRVAGNRVVISSDGKNVTAAVQASNLIKL